MESKAPAVKPSSIKVTAQNFMPSAPHLVNSNMFMRILIALCLVAVVESVSLAACQIYCSSVNGGPSFNNCSPWISFATQSNKTCYNLCVHNCAAVYDGTCIDNSDFRCCLKITPTKTQEFKTSGCNLLYNNLV